MTLAASTDSTVTSRPLAVLPITLEPGAHVPTRGSAGAIGYDLYSHVDEPVYLGPGRRALISTGVRVAIPSGHYGRIAPRSGLAVNNGVDVLAGVIDSDYRGVIKVALINLGQRAFTVGTHTRIAQLIIERASVLTIALVESLDATERLEGGFGSTG